MNCHDAEIEIETPFPQADCGSFHFKTYVLSCLRDLFLFCGSLFTLSWKGQAVTIRVINCILLLMIYTYMTVLQFVSGSCPSTASATTGIDIAYRITLRTQLRVRLATLSVYPPSALDSVTNDTNRIGFPPAAAEGGSLNRITMTPGLEDLLDLSLLKFGGYDSEVKECIGIIHSALMDSPVHSRPRDEGCGVRFKRPKGLLIHGPRGTGKTLLMNSLRESFIPYIKSHQVISPDILLSRSLPLPSPVFISFDKSNSVDFKEMPSLV